MRNVVNELTAELAFILLMWLIAAVAVIVMIGANVTLLQVLGAVVAVRVIVRLAKAK